MTGTCEWEYQYERVKNEKLRAQLAETTAQLAEATRTVELLSKENAVLKRNSAELIPELRDLNKKAEAFVASTHAEIAKWKAEAELATEWYKSYKYQAETNRQQVDRLLVQLEDTERENRELRQKNTFLHGVICQAMDRDSKR